MKGIVFTEFLELVESQFGLDVVDEIIEGTDLPSGGAYTAVGTYEYTELLGLVGALSARTATPVSTLVHTFGKHLFGRFVVSYPFIVDHISTTADFIDKVEGLIHVEVRKLYPDARLPTIEFRRVDDHNAHVEYKSDRPFADLAVGLIEACAEHFGEELTINRVDGASAPNQAKFHLHFVNGLVPCPGSTS